jgi:hypothetical protein
MTGTRISRSSISEVPSWPRTAPDIRRSSGEFVAFLSSNGWNRSPSRQGHYGGGRRGCGPGLAGGRSKELAPESAPRFPGLGGHHGHPAERGAGAGRFWGPCVRIRWSPIRRRDLPFSGRVLMAAGWKPGFSTDYDAVVLAERFGARIRILMLSNIPTGLRRRSPVEPRRPAAGPPRAGTSTGRWPADRMEARGERALRPGGHRPGGGGRPDGGGRRRPGPGQPRENPCSTGEDFVGTVIFPG